jgi:hypothetical protein
VVYNAVRKPIREGFLEEVKSDQALKDEEELARVQGGDERADQAKATGGGCLQDYKTFIKALEDRKLVKKNMSRGSLL